MAAITSPPLVVRKPSGVRVMIGPGDHLPADGFAMYTRPFSQVNSGAAVKPPAPSANPPAPSANSHREVEMLNHCFDDMERFMGRLQQTAYAQGILNQRRKQKKRSKSKKGARDEDLLTMKASPPDEEEFVAIFQKIKYSFSLLDRLKSLIAEPNAPELLHHVFVPLDLLVKTTGGPDLGASVVSPALTNGAVSLLQDHLNLEEKGLWTTLGQNWTSPSSQLGTSIPTYRPVFLDGWEPEGPDGQPWEDPVEAQHRQDASRASRRATEEPASAASERPVSGVSQQGYEDDGTTLPPEGDRMYSCSYDFVARNSSELSVLQGETLEVVESSKRWWKCRNRFDQIGFVPFNILEPLSALSNHAKDDPVARSDSKKVPLAPPTNKYFSYAPPSPGATGPTTTTHTTRPQSMPSTMVGEDGGKGFAVNEELLQRLANGRPASMRTLVIPRTADTSAPLDYLSPPPQVEAWLTGKGFSQETVQCLGVLSGAQLFSLNKEELRAVLPQEGARVYSQVMVQRALLEDVHNATELETVMEKQKLKVDLRAASEIL